ncbi:MAG: DUF559 domain-containing protein [Deltaproteobacteria bacterium]|nr:DUF559 domain-containing protein [Deltaproteobacteria bacterium]
MNPDDESLRWPSRQLHTQSTSEQQTLWWRLGAKHRADFKFRRQHRIGPDFADLCCIKRRLIIEIDGSQHAE